MHTKVLQAWQAFVPGLAGAWYSAGDLWLCCLVLPMAQVTGSAEREEEAGCQTRALLRLHDNEKALDEERYGQVLVVYRLSLRGVNHLMGPGHLVNDRGGPSPLNPRLQVVPPSMWQCSSSSDGFASSVFPLRGVALFILLGTCLRTYGAISM